MTLLLLVLLALAGGVSSADECEENRAERNVKLEARSFQVLLQKSQDHAKVALNTAEIESTSESLATSRDGRGSSDCSCRVADKSLHVPPSAKTGSDAAGLAPCFVEVPPESPKAQLATIIPDHFPDDLPDIGTDVNMIYLMGDSHAGIMGPAIKKVIDGRPLKLFYGGNCFYAPWNANFKENREKAEPGSEKKCAELKNNLEKHFAENLKQGDLVFVSNFFGPFRPQDMAEGTHKLNFERELARYREQLVSLHTIVSGRGGKMVLFGSNTILGPLGSSCIPTYWEPDAPSKCERNKAEYKKEHGVYLEPLMNMYAELARTKSGIAVFDMFDLFCDDQTCGAFIPGTKTLAIADGNHLTVAASEYLAPYLCDFMSSNGMFSK